ncbi:MAG: DUF1631 domain-containing protein [Moraxellaceae bacterium]|nr:DUF1631 domain-containing protein [Moraxellaceae bacterium]MBK7299872.1 DUF1631 domain-containing protein [Moraxellaceae bacterium]MBK8326317.1 DUF1631 domain-containing protein [Moraxellaceae bacterium]HQV80274.1 DUF1631 domain-containing protein [Agitococcus sp.]
MSIPQKLPAVLEGLRVAVEPRLNAAFHNMLTRLEEIIYQWCQGLSDSEQQRYMDIIIAVRRERAQIEMDIARAITSSFMQLPNIKAPVEGAKKVSSLSGFDFDSLSLVDSEDMEITVTVDSMVARTRLDYSNLYSLLRQRFLHVAPSYNLIDKNFPLDTGALALHFQNAIKHLVLEVSQKVVILRVFQQEFLTQLWPILEEANKYLISAGVLPELKSTFSSGKSKESNYDEAMARKEQQDADKAAKGNEPEKKLDTEDIFTFLKDVHKIGNTGDSSSGLPIPAAANGEVITGATYHGGEYVGGGGVGLLSAAAVGGSVAAVPIVPENIAATAQVQALATEQLVGLLSKLQESQPRAKLSEDDSSPSVTQVRTGIRDNLKSDEKRVETVRQADEDVINLVSMLFDFILDDDDLPMAMKALLGRLQIPLLKVAIIDKTFFNAEKHKARQLLNLLSKAGIGWNQKDQGSDALYTKIEEVVFRILNEFISDIVIFDELFQEFSDFYDQQQKRTDSIDKRTRDAEEGRARADMARAMVQQTLNRRLTGRQLPLVVVKLLQEGWKHVLYINCLKEGTESEPWKQAVKVVDAVVWSVIPQSGAEWIARLRNVSPKLMNSLRKGLAAVNYDALATESLLKELADVHNELMGGHTMPTVTVLDPESAKSSAPSAGTISSEQINTAQSTPTTTVVLPTDSLQPAMAETLSSDNEHLQKVNHLNVGSWVEFIQTDRRDRHKLVARIRSVDKLIFANRRGIKVAEMTAMKLAVDMSQGRARIIDEAQVLDRALESVIGNLRTLGEQQKQQS